MVVDAVNPEMPQIPNGAFDFNDLYENQRQVAERVYKGVEPEFDPSLPLLVMVAGPSTVGKDSIVNALKDARFFSRVITATSKPREPHEREDDYIWMRQRRDDETVEQYHQDLVVEYDLIESKVVHDGALYGLPRTSLEDARKRNPRAIPVLRIEPRGAVEVKAKLAGQYNVIIVGILPDSYDQIWKRLIATKPDKAYDRFRRSLEIINELRGLANYYLHNSEEPNVQKQSGLEVSINSLRRVVLWYRSQLLK